MDKRKMIIIVSCIVLLMASTLIGVNYYKSLPEKIFNKATNCLASKDYIQAKGKLQEVLKKDSNNEEAQLIIDIIDNYENAKELYSQNKYTEALKVLSRINKKYVNYSIKDDIDELKSQCDEKIKKTELDNKINSILATVDEKDYDNATSLIEEIKKEALSSEQQGKVLEIENRISSELEQLAKEEADKNEEEKKNNDANNNLGNNNSSSTGLKIASTSVAGYSDQIIAVVSDGGSYATLVRYEKNSDGSWREIDSIGARLGANGMDHPSVIYEMDKRTPTGAYSLTEAFGIYNDPGSKLPYRVVTDNDYWVDDVDSPYYNQWMEGPADGRWNSAEHLISEQGYYNYAVVIDYNRWPVVAGKSSAIFLHCDLGTYTYGCVAVAEYRLVEILNWLDPAKNPHIIIAKSWDELYSY